MSLAKHRKQIEKFDFFLKKDQHWYKVSSGILVSESQMAILLRIDRFHYVCRDSPVVMEEKCDSEMRSRVEMLTFDRTVVATLRSSALTESESCAQRQCYARPSNSNAIQPYGTPNGRQLLLEWIFQFESTSNQDRRMRPHEPHFSKLPFVEDRWH